MQLSSTDIIYPQAILAMEQIEIVNNYERLVEVCARAKAYTAIALDTEFVRTRTYYANLGLIQLYFTEQVYIIDCLAIHDFKPFIELLSDTSITKIIHAGSEDLEIFKQLFATLPANYLDTQVMASFLAIGANIGLNTLTEKFFNITIDKNLSRTDWLHRPLTQESIYYAAADVFYLLPIYHLLQQLLSTSPWQQAVVEECQLRLKNYQQILEPTNSYLNVKNAELLTTGLQLARLQALSQWRLEQAIKKNLPLNFVLQEKNMFTVAKYGANNQNELIELGLTEKEIRLHADTILQLLNNVAQQDLATYPPLLINWQKNKALKKIYSHMQQLAKEITPIELAPELISSKKIIIEFILYCCQFTTTSPRLLNGWRQPFGLQLQQAILAMPEFEMIKMK